MICITAIASVLCIATLGKLFDAGVTVPSKDAVEHVLEGATKDKAAAVWAAYGDYAVKWDMATANWADSGPSHILECRIAQRQLSTDFEQEVARIVQADDRTRERWNRDWRRERCLSELSAIMRQPIRDVIVLLESVSPAQESAVEPFAQAYLYAIDIVLIEWDAASDALLARAYIENREVDRQAARRDIAEYARRVADIQKEYVSRISDVLTGVDRDRFVKSATGHPCSHLFQPFPIDVIMEDIVNLGELPAETRQAAESIYSDYCLHRDIARSAVIRSHEKWMSPRWMQERMRKREEEQTAQRNTGEWMWGHPALNDLRRLEQMEYETITRLREVLGDAQVARLPSKSRLLVGAWTLQADK